MSLSVGAPRFFKESKDDVLEGYTSFYQQPIEDILTSVVKEDGFVDTRFHLRMQWLTESEKKRVEVWCKKHLVEKGIYTQKDYLLLGATCHLLSKEESHTLVDHYLEKAKAIKPLSPLQRIQYYVWCQLKKFSEFEMDLYDFVLQTDPTLLMSKEVIFALYEHFKSIRHDHKNYYTAKAADLDYPLACFDRANYFKRSCIQDFYLPSKNMRKAFRYYVRAAKEGCTDSLVALGLFYQAGKKMRPDFNSAWPCLTIEPVYRGRKRTDQSDEYVEQDIFKAQTYFQRAIERDNANALFFLGFLELEEQLSFPEMSMSLIAESLRKKSRAAIHFMTFNFNAEFLTQVIVKSGYKKAEPPRLIADLLLFYFNLNRRYIFYKTFSLETEKFVTLIYPNKSLFYELISHEPLEILTEVLPLKMANEIKLHRETRAEKWREILILLFTEIPATLIYSYLVSTSPDRFFKFIQESTPHNATVSFSP